MSDKLPGLGGVPEKAPLQSFEIFASKNNEQRTTPTHPCCKEPTMSREIENHSDRTTPSTSNSFRNAKTRSQHTVESLERAQMSSSLVNRVTMEQSEHTDHSSQQALTVSQNCTPQAKCQFCEFIETSHWESASDDITDPRSVSTCALCTEPPSCRPCQSASESGKGPQLPVCVDPHCLQNICDDCPESICDACSDHGESCEECVVQCGSNCGTSLTSDASMPGIYDDCPLDDSYSELFGDQAAQMFGLDGCLPQLPSDTLPADFRGSRFCPGDADAPEASLDSYNRAELTHFPMQSLAQYPALKAAESVSRDAFISSSPASAMGGYGVRSRAGRAGAAAEGAARAPASSSRRSHRDALIRHRTSPISAKLNVLPLAKSAESTENKHVTLAPTDGTVVQDPHVVRRRTFSNVNTPPAQCQWADANGQPCSQIFLFGTDLHEHLKTAHSVHRSNFCHWLPCRFSIHSPTPHRYATSVERHTWGHSGYRPYKCPFPTCSYGFSAAAVRDEHFANFHLKRKMFACDMCIHQCTSARNLKRHKDDTHKTERFQCEFCHRSGKLRLFPRASNLARHFRKCKYVLALFPDAAGAATGKIADDWFPTGYRGGHQGMDKAKIRPPDYLSMA